MKMRELIKKINIKESRYKIFQDFDTILESLEKNLFIISQECTEDNLNRFLYEYLIHNNKFVVSAKLTYTDKDYLKFCRALTLFTQIEGSNENYAIFDLIKLKWELYENIEKQFDDSYLKILIDKVNQVENPSSKNQKAKFFELKSNILKIINSLKEGTLRSTISTKVPLLPLHKTTTINSSFDSYDVRVKLIPNFFNMGQSLVTSDDNQIVIPSSSSNWQHGVTQVEIDVFGLLDHNKKSHELNFSHGINLPETGWTNLFYFTYSLLNNLFWQLYRDSYCLGSWNLKPSDMSTINYAIKIDDNPIFSLSADPLGLTNKIMTRPIDEDYIEISIIENNISWAEQAFALSKEYLSSGLTNEALFWINVGVESFFEKRSEMICQNVGVDFEELSSSRCYWQNAKEKVAEYDSELAENIEWSTSISINPSWYAKIKYLSKKGAFEWSSSEVLKKYNEISGKRNPIFHGSEIKPVSVDAIKKAHSAFEWLFENYK